MSKLSQAIRTRFAGRRVVIAGDMVADQFLYGTISRVSREAPVFILNHDETDTRPGGAANAAANVAALGGQPVIVGFIGDDANGKTLLSALADAGVECGSIVSDARLQTTTKVRVLAGQEYAMRQQVIRIDYAHKSAIPADLESQLAERFASACDQAEAIIFSDYNYGAASATIFEIAQRKAKELGIPLVIDSRFRLGEFQGATAGTPNQEEVEQILGKNPAEADCEQLRETLGYKALLVTRGNKGMTLYEKGAEPRHFDAVGSKEPVDVTGAGDTVIGAFALGLASGLSFADAAEIANHAGSIVVMKRGTAVATPDELIQSVESQSEDLKHATPTR
jgi:rfaE bifunctional protein kinase chain/domain